MGIWRGDLKYLITLVNFIALCFTWNIINGNNIKSIKIWLFNFLIGFILMDGHPSINFRGRDYPQI